MRLMDTGASRAEVEEEWSIDDVAERLEWLDAVDEVRAATTANGTGTGAGFTFPGGMPHRR